MKKVCLVVLILISSIVVYFCNQGKDKVVFSDLALENIEALARNEGLGGDVLYEHHCGSAVGTQCINTSVTGPTCSHRWSCP